MKCITLAQCIVSVLNCITLPIIPAMNCITLVQPGSGVRAARSGVIQHYVIVCIVLHSTRFPRFKRVFDSERSRKIVKKKFRAGAFFFIKCLASAWRRIILLEAEAPR